MLYDKDAGHTSFLEDVYECQSRYPAGSWGLASVPFTDVVRNETVLNIFPITSRIIDK